MSIYGALDRRLRSEDLSQALSLILLFVSLTLVFSWTGNPLTANDSWFNVTAVRRASLGILALYLALRASRQPAVEQLASYLALLCVALVTVPFELVSFAASYPAASLVASTGFDLLFPLGFYSIGLILARVMPRVPWMTLVLAPLVLVVFTVVDELLSATVLGPLGVVTNADWPLLVTWTLLSVLGLLVMLTARRSES